MGGNDNYLGLMDVSSKIGVAYWRITYAVQAGKVPPPLKVAGRYLFTFKDVERLRRHFAKEANATTA